MINLANQFDRKTLVDWINANENKERKANSLRQFEVFKDRLHQYVLAYLSGQYSNQTVREMPIISSINLCKRIISQEASLYKQAPKREFVGVTDEQKAVLVKVYSDMNVDAKMNKSNNYYKLQNQNLLQVVPKDGKLSIKCLLGHHYDVVEGAVDPENADVYILSVMDKSMYLQKQDDIMPSATGSQQFVYNGSDGVNLPIADKEDYKKQQLYVVWSRGFNFIMNQSGEVVSSNDVMNPLAETETPLPFIDIACDKDFEYFVRQEQTTVDFSIQFNAALSDLWQIVKMQGFAQAYYKSSSKTMPENIQIGPNMVLKLPVDAANPDTEFGYANPNPDLQGSIQFLESLLSTFLSAKGVNPKVVTGSGQVDRFNSGIERMLALVEKFEASQSDMSTYMDAEKKLFKIVKSYLNTYAGTDILNYKIAPLSDEADVLVEFQKPSMIMSEEEKLASIEKKLELGLISQVDALMIAHNMSKEQAEVKLKEIGFMQMPEIKKEQIEDVV